jgi:uncharacterized protein with NRDE domain
MCLIVVAQQPAPGIALIVAANRDELFERPALPAAFWPDHPDIVAGRDQQAGGTWLGVSRSGRFAAITNYRAPGERRATAPSRGALVSDFLKQSRSPQDYLSDIDTLAGSFNGFSLLIGIPGELWFYSNRIATAADRAFRISPGIHGLSNRLLDEAWPKVVRSKARVAELVRQPFDRDRYFELLGDDTPAPDADLPDTGIGLERERVVSAIRIRDPHYGTRCSTVVMLKDSGEAEFHERSFLADGSVSATASIAFTWAPRAPAT